ncbi:hypothetical protein LKK83_22315 [Phormidium sp. CCY1219]|nr:hypothetical protein [Phormidium sp. CCY1219]
MQRSHRSRAIDPPTCPVNSSVHPTPTVAISNSEILYRFSVRMMQVNLNYKAVSPTDKQYCSNAHHRVGAERAESIVGWAMPTLQLVL